MFYFFICFFVQYASLLLEQFAADRCFWSMSMSEYKERKTKCIRFCGVSIIKMYHDHDMMIRNNFAFWPGIEKKKTELEWKLSFTIVAKDAMVRVMFQVSAKVKFPTANGTVEIREGKKSTANRAKN